MAYFFIFCKLLLHLLLLPLKMLIVFLFYMCYSPSLKFNPNLYLNYKPDDLEGKQKEILNNLPIDSYINDGDGAKFLGLAYTSCKDKRIWDGLTELFYKEKTFLREPWRENYDCKAFSGDMWAGFFSAIITAINENHITKEQKSQLKEIIDYTLFKEKTLTFKHPTEKEQDRGFMFPFWALCPDFFDVIALFYVNEKLTNQFKYKFFRYLFTILGFPLMFSLRQGFFIKSIYTMNFFTEHSSLVKAYYLYKFLNYKFLSPVILKQCDDHHWFADSAKILLDLEGHSDFYNMFVYDFINTKSPASVPQDWITEYFTFKGFEKKTNYTKYALPYRYRTGAKYLDDSKPMEPKFYIQEKSKADIIHLINW